MREALIVIVLSLITGILAGQAQWWSAEHEYYHIPITEAGVYRLSEQVLEQTAIPWEEVDPGHWELWLEGQAIPIYSGEEQGEFYLEFAASSPDGIIDSLLISRGRDQLLNPASSMFSDTAHYYLSWADEETGIGQSVDVTEPPTNALRQSAYLKTDKEVFSETWVKPYSKIGGANIYLSEYLAGEGFAAPRAQSFSETISADQPIDGASGQLSIRFLGDFGNHEFALIINGEERWSASRNSFTLEQVDLTLDANELGEPITYLLEGQLDNRDEFYVAERKLVYRTTLSAEQATGMGRVDTGQVILDWAGNRQEEFVYYDITHKLRYVFPPDMESWLSETPAAHQFQFAQRSAIRTLPVPQKCEIDFSPVGPSIDYIILTGKRLGGGSANPAIQAYAAYRSSEAGGSYEVKIVNVEDLYFKYGFGIPRHPLGIRLFAQHLDSTLQQQPLIYIIGKGREYRYIRSPEALQSEDHRGFSVPTYGYPSSDNLLFARMGESAPMFPVGRLSVETSDEIWSYLDKVKLQEETRQIPSADNTFWRKKILHLVGGGEIQPLITTYMENMGNLLSESVWDPELIKFERGSSSSSERPLTDEIYDEINEGSSLVTFFGHSATNSLGFDINIPFKYSNSPRHPFLLALGCYGGNINTSQASVGEIYNSFEGGGFVGSIASSGPGEVTRLYLFAREFYEAMGARADQETIAEMFQVALQKRAGSDPRHVQQLMYFGDPALRIYEANGPDYSFDPQSSQISPQAINVGQDSFSITVDIVNLGRNIDQDLPLRIQRRGPGGSILQEQNIVVSAPGNRISVTTYWPVGNDEGAGLNRLFFYIDPEEEIEEWPLPAAQNNNELQIGGEDGFPFFVFNNGIELAWPYDYAMISSDSLPLVAYSSNPLAGPADYLFQIDTIPEFTSTFKKSTQVTASGGRLEWDLPFDLEPEKVYYWRAALLGADGVDTLWKSASFTYVPGKEGWNQSHIGQWLQSDSLFLNAGRFRLELPKEGLNITIQKRVKGGAIEPNFVANGINVGSVNRAWNLVDEGIGICVIDTLIFTLQPNPPGGLYGSVNDNRTTRAFVFRTDNPSSRADAVRFLDSIVPPNSHVFIFTIYDENRKGESLQLETWAADTSVYGTSLIEALERRGATSLQNLMQEERQVYNFFYRQSRSGFTRLQEDFLFSTEGVLVNSETMGRRLPEGFFQTVPVDINRDTISVSVAFDKLNSGDSVQVLGITPSGTEAFESTAADTFLWEVPGSIPSFSFFVKLMNFQTRRAPLFKHVRVYQDPIPDYFWSPPAMGERPDSVFIKGTLFDWYSMITAVGNTELSDSLTVSFRIQNQGEVVYRDTMRLGVIQDDPKVMLNIETSDWPTGFYSLTAEINPERESLEKRYSNNILSVPFKLIKEQAKPILEVTFDNEIITQGDLLRRRPQLIMSIQKVEGIVPISAEQLQYELIQPDGSLYALADELTFSTVDTAGVLRGEWVADLDLEQEGSYQLEVIYTPLDGGPTDDIVYRVEFRRRNLEEVRSIVLAPNPTTGILFVHYDILGAEGPSGWSIELMSADGRLVWQSDGQTPLPIGNERIDLGVIPPQVSAGFYVFRFRLLDSEALLYDGEAGQIQGRILLLRP